MAVLGPHFRARAFSSCGERGLLFIAVREPLTIAASLVAEHSLQTCRLSSCGSRAQLFRGPWDLPRPGLEPVSPALAGRLSTTAPPGKPRNSHILVGSLSPHMFELKRFFFFNSRNFTFWVVHEGSFQLSDNFFILILKNTQDES